MTANQISYANLVENRRHNMVTEGETQRYNTLTTTETNRHNIANESETSRHNRADESIRHNANIINDLHYQRTDYETNRHNLNTEALTAEQNQINWYNAYSNRMSAQASGLQAQSAWKNASVNAFQAASQDLLRQQQIQESKSRAALAETQRVSEIFDQSRAKAQTNYYDSQARILDEQYNWYNINQAVDIYSKMSGSISNIGKAAGSIGQLLLAM